MSPSIQARQQLDSVIQKQGVAKGTFLNLGSPVTTEICARYLDWVLIDQEHGPGGRETLYTQLLAARAGGALSIVRVPSSHTTAIKQAADLGADGVMIPQITSAEEAASALKALRYPPAGTRGVSKINRGCGFGADFEAKFLDQGASLIGMVQIETLAALESIESIAALAETTVLFVGPLDLSVNLGCRGNFQHPDFTAACNRVIHAAQENGKYAGILTGNISAAEEARAQGFNIIAIGSDGFWIEENARRISTGLY